MKGMSIVSLTKRMLETQEKTPARKLERVRERIRTVSRAVQTTEGRLLDFDTADDIMCALHTAARELEELIVTVAVMQRREAR